MQWIIVKYLITAALVVGISEAAKRSDRFGALLAALPVVTLLTLIWLHVEKQPEAKIANHAWLTFWYVLPTLPMFAAFPVLYRQFGFWLALLACALLTFACFWGLSKVLVRYGIQLT
jgi:hypothetical protein